MLKSLIKNQDKNVNYLLLGRVATNIADSTSRKDRNYQ